MENNNSFIRIQANIDVNVELSSDIVAAVRASNNAQPLNSLMRSVSHGIEDAMRDAASKEAKVPDLTEARKMVETIKGNGHCCDCSCEKQESSADE